jgi:hypothetical protein
MVVNNVQAKYAGASFTYEFELLSDGNSRIAGATVNPSGGTASWAYPTDLERDTPYRWRARARLGNNVGPWTGSSRFFTVFEKRAADPAPGTRLPFPNWGAAIVQQVAAQRPDLLANSCQDHGGSWAFMDAVVDALRLEDTRFGYNCKRGNCNDPSQDVIAYNYTAGPDEGNSGVYIIDIIQSHCGSPTPGWGDVTAVTVNSGTIGRFTSRGRW